MSRVRRGERIGATLLGLAAIGASPGCLAEGTWTGSVAAVSDYVFRGVSETSGVAALQGGVNFRIPQGWFAGVWATNVDPYPSGSHAIEVNAYTGRGWAVSNDWSARASYTRYIHARDRRSGSYDYGEFAVTVAFRDVLAATVSYQPDSARYSWFGYVHNRPAFAYELTARLPLTENVALTGGVGYYDLTRLFGTSYWSGSAGVSYTQGRLELDITRFVTEGTARRLFDGSANNRWVAAILWRF